MDVYQQAGPTSLMPEIIRNALAEQQIPVSLRSAPHHNTVIHTLSSGKALSLALPVTFTPYASVKPCSARCRFCSENLRADDGWKLTSSQLRPGPEYFLQLRHALTEMDGVPLGLSLSGLEMSDDPEWFITLLQTLKLQESTQRHRFQEKILYSNGAGLSDPKWGLEISSCLSDFPLDRVEFSRHSHIESENQDIMRFRPSVAAKSNAGFTSAVARAADAVATKLVCIPQNGGIDSWPKLEGYLDWAACLPVEEVIVREFSALSSAHSINTTERYIRDHRIELIRLLRDGGVLAGRSADWTLEKAKHGYYFWNISFRYKDRLLVTFEAADYE